ncbi:Transposase [Legionella massiliensis]|uniref:Transposase n=1 Tax=Legionella massiliensis TaxID=1034943 RepID=A0A078KSC5_9GAMM|nr:transposase [Legionella massiliensis]CDZ77360.1 Transposase [Legionella massiliensis]CEE13098.1 Transposase IS200 like protein [Legionella massiliensis]
MPRASRVYASGEVFHITHRCHQKQFLLRFKQDRDRYRYWLFEARKRYGFSILNYMITSNHIHLLVKCTNEDTVPLSMQLVAGRTAQEYNLRKKRTGAFWEDRYHVSIVEAEDYLHRCFTYIDMNMVRTGQILHPIEWEHCGYYELFSGRQRYQVLAITELVAFLGYSSFESFKENHQETINDVLKAGKLNREPFWTENKIIGSPEFIKYFS